MATHTGRGAECEASEPPIDLQDRSVAELRHVGPQVAAVLRNRGVHTIGDLLAIVPRRYLDLREADDWRRVRHGAYGSLVAVEGRVEDVRSAGPPGRRRLMVALREARGTTLLRVVFFHAKAGLSARFPMGGTVRVVGVLREGMSGPELVQPKVLASGTRLRPIEPIYPAIGSIAPGNVARIVDGAVLRAREWGDPVPPAVARALGLPTAAQALVALHAPDAGVTPEALRALTTGTSPAHRRLGFEELLALNVALERARRLSGPARSFPRDPSVVDTVARRLSLSLTGAQRAAIDVLQDDLTRHEPMRRLLVGDVGSGKTAVALAATLAVLRGGAAPCGSAPPPSWPNSTPVRSNAGSARTEGPWPSSLARQPCERANRPRE